MRVCPHGDAEGASETKVSELEIVIFVDEEILWLEVTVEYAVRVAVEET